jgi:hypothetical protein
MLFQKKGDKEIVNIWGKARYSLFVARFSNDEARPTINDFNIATFSVIQAYRLLLRQCRLILPVHIVPHFLCPD